ncbi:hypothetical protein CLOHAE12215_01402 [Clostridium haemolyticum]|uniref:hypothetical protein n=1 Tax=Clostridium haemolyticum TaxID=84025 RepID=UPI001C3A8C06|nr:hypothetical protein [Clostridium haemolyticum]CAG7839986.1 hypothetical protein CLOHAE12215_01402 [Clostridium haemolyticum]
MKDIGYNSEQIFRAIRNITDKIIKSTQFCYIEVATVLKDNEDGTYKVGLNKNEIDVPSLHGIKYDENEVVYLLISNKDLSKRVILDSVYNSRNLEEKIKKDIMKEVEKMIDEKLNTVNEKKDT